MHGPDTRALAKTWRRELLNSRSTTPQMVSSTRRPTTAPLIAQRPHQASWLAGVSPAVTVLTTSAQPTPCRWWIVPNATSPRRSISIEMASSMRTASITSKSWAEFRFLPWAAGEGVVNAHQRAYHRGRSAAAPRRQARSARTSRLRSAVRGLTTSAGKKSRPIKRRPQAREALGPVAGGTK